MHTTCLTMLCAVALALPVRASSDASGSRDLNEITRDEPIAASMVVANGCADVSFERTPQSTPADVAGAWALTVETAQGTGMPSVTFKQDGEQLTGQYSSQVFGEQKVTGTIKGNAITFAFTGSVDGNTLTVTYSGTVDKDTMKGKVTLGDLGEGKFTGKKK